MRKNILVWILFCTTLVLTTTALVASAILLVDYIRHAPVFCDVDGGCQAVKASVLAHPFGIPMPAIGVTGLFGLGLASLVPGSTARFIQAAFATGAAVTGVFLLLVQRSMGVFCPFCVVVDTASVILGIASAIRLVAATDPPAVRLLPGLAATALVTAIGVPIAIGSALKPRPEVAGGTPAVIVDEMKLAAPKVSVVDFVDFECPYCRMTNADLEPLLEQRKDKLRVVRKQVPLRMHPHAPDAARAACCGEDQGKGAELADALFRAPPEELTPEGCEKLARDLGLDMARFHACVQDPATQARIDKDREAFRSVQGHGLPTIWIDATKLEGAQGKEQLASALDAAIRAHNL